MYDIFHIMLCVVYTMECTQWKHRDSKCFRIENRKNIKFSAVKLSHSWLRSYGSYLVTAAYTV